MGPKQHAAEDIAVYESSFQSSGCPSEWGQKKSVSFMESNLEMVSNQVGENFFELYNGHPTVHNSGDATHAGTERMWDIMNSFRLQTLQLPLMYGLGTDDGHNYFETAAGKGAQPGRDWVVVLAKTLEPDAIVDALESGILS